MQDKINDLAFYSACLFIWLLFLLIIYFFTKGGCWLIVKFILTIIFIYGIRDWFVDYTLLKFQKSREKSSK